MLSVGQFAKLAKVTPRTLRYYESIGLIPTAKRGENNYRHYDKKWIAHIERIRELQGLGFSLDEVQSILQISQEELTDRLEMQLRVLSGSIDELELKRQCIRQLLSVSKKIESGESITTTEKELYMENLRQEVLSGLRAKYSSIESSTLKYLERDTWISNNPEVNQFIDAVQKCIQFANSKNLTLGTARGGAPASLSLYGLGISGVDPLKHQMIPERLSTQTPSFHIDVEYGRGQEFVDFCKDVNKSLSYGEIQAFKMPLIDIVQSTHKKIGKVIDYDKINDDADEVLNHFRAGNVEKIFQFDPSENALCNQFEKLMPGFSGTEKIINYLVNQRIHNFRDILNITALWRPNCPELVARIDEYSKIKHFGKCNLYGDYKFSDKMLNWLKPNFGMIVYHEDVIMMVSDLTGWDFVRSNLLRRFLMKKDNRAKDQCEDWGLLQSMVAPEVANIIAEESRWSFCLPHVVSFGKFTK